MSARWRVCIFHIEWHACRSNRAMVRSWQIGIGAFFWPFVLPTLAGNIVGGSLIFALISHAQVRSDEKT